MEILLVLLALAAGALLPLQAAINAALRTHAGRAEWAAVVSFAVGLLGLLAWVTASRQPAPALAALGRAPWWAWIGGLLGAAYVTLVILLTPRLGVAATLGLAVAGQMGAALAMDHFGWLGLAARPVSAAHLAGAALLVAGVVLLRR
jgi:transporter family-2 protein